MRRLGRDQRSYRDPAIGIACDHVIEAGGTAIFEELGELFGCEAHMAARAITPALGQEIKKAMAKATRHYAALDQSSFGGGNITGGLSTIEEKSMGTYAQSGTKPIAGMLGPGGRILEGRGTLADVGAEIFDLIKRVAAGDPTKSEALGHQEFILGYKSFEPLGPSCLPV